MKYCSICSKPIWETPSNPTIAIGFYNALQWCTGHIVPSGYYYTITTAGSTVPIDLSQYTATNTAITNWISLPSKREPVPDAFYRAFIEGGLEL